MVWIIAGGMLGDIGAGIVVAFIVFILMNIGHAVVEANNEKNNVVPLQREVAQIRAEIDSKHKKIVKS